MCKNPACLKKARTSGALARSLGCEITDDVYAELEREIAEAVRLGEAGETAEACENKDGEAE